MASRSTTRLLVNAIDVMSAFPATIVFTTSSSVNSRLRKFVAVSLPSMMSTMSVTVLLLPEAFSVIPVCAVVLMYLRISTPSPSSGNRSFLTSVKSSSALIVVVVSVVLESIVPAVVRSIRTLVADESKVTMKSELPVIVVMPMPAIWSTLVTSESS